MVTDKYLTNTQLLKKYDFISENMLKNILTSNLHGFREKCVRKIGKRILIDEMAFLVFLSERTSEKSTWQKR